MCRQLRDHLAGVVREFRPRSSTPWLAGGVCASLMGQEHGIPVVAQGSATTPTTTCTSSHRGFHVMRGGARRCCSTASPRSATRELAGLTHDTHIIYHGSRSTCSPDTARTEYGQRIVTVAQLIPRKNHQLLLHAFTKLPRTAATASLLFVGGGPLRRAWQQKLPSWGSPTASPSPDGCRET
jgi:glycosyltransferase involved in cell wall biosynthesis